MANLYIDPDNVYWFGDEQGVIPLAPSALSLLSGFRDSVAHAVGVDAETRGLIVLSLDMVSLFPLSECPQLRLVAQDHGVPHTPTDKDAE